MSAAPHLRLSVVGIVAFSLFAALFARLWYLQVMASEEFQVVAEANRIRVVQTEAPRGRILDRDGTVLVDNRVSTQVAIDRAVFADLPGERRREVLERLAAALTWHGMPTTAADLEARLADPRHGPFAPAPVATEVSEDLKTWVAEQADDLPAVSAARVAVRSYPFGALGAHVIGYVGRITEQELEEKQNPVKPYTPNDVVGKAGVELAYERYLRGVPGERRIEVDAEGRFVRVVSERPPAPGKDVVLAMDIDVQAVAEHTLRQGLERAQAPAGSIVVMDPRGGGVVAMASYPTFAPAEFVGGISHPEWAFLNDPANRFPLNNRATQGQYAPGSTFKLFTAISGLRSGLVAPGTPFRDAGSFTLAGCRGPGCTVRNAGGKAHGRLDLRRATAVSSNAYFAWIGARFWAERESLGTGTGLQEGVAQFGLGERQGIDLPGERSGRMPSPQWRREFCQRVACVDDGWYMGDNMNLSLGQGEVLMTPLQIANSYATFANGGTRYAPRAVLEVRDPSTGAAVRTIEPRAAARLELPPDARQALLDGLVGATRPGGTAAGAFAGFPASWPVAGKTGTAQVHGREHTAVFGAFGPAFDPRYAIAVVMEEAGFGGARAAPVARRVLDVLSGAAAMPTAPLGGHFAQDEGVAPPEVVAGALD